ncbi:MAG: hypothetical protein LBD78_08635 [Spirochaetaceae bacterium]|jgi:hypothetical protein|nr:hypothetical protein [Spirochaetaceae bacterium]
MIRIEGVGKPPDCKLIRVYAELEGNSIRTIRIRGDFFASPEEAFDRVGEGLSGVSLTDLAGTFDALLREGAIEAFGINGAGVAAVLAAALPAAGPEGGPVW